MRSLFDPDMAENLLRRIHLLEAENPPRWGRMTCHQMVCHLGDAFRGALGDGGTLHHRGGLLTVPLIRWLAVFVLPWPRARIRAPEEFMQSDAAGWDEDRSRLIAAIERFLERARTPNPHWEVHPKLGRLSTRQWGWLAYKHTDHHLRQFGV